MSTEIFEGLKRFTTWLGFWLLLAIAVNMTLYALPLARDDSDPVDSAARSNMSVFTDHKTGCQYLSARKDGGITPRLAADGSHLGCKKGEQQ